MSHRCNHITCFVPALLLSLSLFTCSLLGCRHSDEVEKPEMKEDETMANGTVVLQTDSDEWIVHVFMTDVFYGSGYSVDSPYHIPYKSEAQVLHTIEFGSSKQRFVTCDGFTFGMPSASVSKAGTKTKYSVLGLWRHRNVIYIEF